MASDAPTGSTADGRSRHHRSSTRARGSPSAPLGVKIVAVLQAIGGLLDGVLGLAVLSYSAGVGLFFLAIAGLELYLSYGLFGMRRWAYWGTILVQGIVLLALLAVGDVAPALIKLLVVGYLLAKSDAGWR